MADVELNVHIANVDEAIEKAVRLVMILKEAGTLVDELASELEKLELLPTFKAGEITEERRYIYDVFNQTAAQKENC